MFSTCSIDTTDEKLRELWNKENFVLYEKDLYNSLCFNNLMINEEYFHIQRQVECDYSDYYNKYTVDMFNGNNQIIHRKDSFDLMFQPYMNSYRNTGMHKNIMIDILNNLKPDEYDEYLQPDHGYLRLESLTSMMNIYNQIMDIYDLRMSIVSENIII